MNLPLIAIVLRIQTKEHKYNIAHSAIFIIFRQIIDFLKGKPLFLLFEYVKQHMRNQ